MIILYETNIPNPIYIPLWCFLNFILYIFMFMILRMFTETYDMRDLTESVPGIKAKWNSLDLHNG